MPNVAGHAPYRPWTDGEDHRLRQMFDVYGADWRTIADDLKRTRDSVRSRAWTLLLLRPHEPKSAMRGVDYRLGVRHA